MPKDFSDFEQEATVLGWHPGNGEFVLLQLTDVNLQVALVEKGAHAAKDGSLVGVFQTQRVPPLVEITRKDGSKETEGGKPEPAHVQLLFPTRENLVLPRKKADGSWELVNVYFLARNPIIKSLQPLLDIADLPDKHPNGMDAYNLEHIKAKIDRIKRAEGEPVQAAQPAAAAPAAVPVASAG